MTSSEQRIAEAIASLTSRLEAWSVDDAATKAHEFVRDMLRNGWRTTPARVEPLPDPGTPADATTAADQIRARLGWAREEGL